MKKRILGIIFVLMLAATMLPAGVVTADVADGNLIVNGSFEIAAEEGSEEASQTGAKGWFRYNAKLGERMVYDENATGAVAPVANTGSAYFAIQKASSGKEVFLYQPLRLEAGKKYTVSYLTKIVDGNSMSCDSGIIFNATVPSVDYDEYITRYIQDKYATDWRRVSRTFIVPGEAGTVIDAVFAINKYNNAAKPESPTGYIDDVCLVEETNQGNILYTVHGFENYAYTATGSNNAYTNPRFSSVESSTAYKGTTKVSGTGFRNGDTLYAHLHDDGNIVLRFSTSASGVSNIKFDVTQIDFAGKGVTVGTPLHLSFKARLVDIPAGLDTSVTPTFGEYTMQGTFKEGLIGPYVVGSDNKAPAMTDAEGNAPYTGSTVYLKYPALTTYGMKDLALSTKNVNEADKNANEWVQYDFIFPYQNNLTQLAFFSGYTGIRFTGACAAGYSWEMDDLELLIADTTVLPGNGTLEPEHTYRMLNNASIKVQKAYSNIDGSGTEYTFADGGYQNALQDGFPFSCRTTLLDAAKKVKPYSKTATTAGAAYIKADEATGASVITSVYKMNGSIRTLVGFEVTEVEDGGFVAIPEIALADIVDEAGTYEVKSYIWSVNTIIPISERVITRVAE